MAKRKVKKEIIEWLDKPQRIVVGGVVIGVGSWLIYKFGKKIIETARQKSTENLIDDSPAVRQAMLLRNAMNPSGISFMMSFDQTNEDMIYDTAKQISNIDEVIKAYRKLYNSSLLHDLQGELDSNEYQKFLTLISSSPIKSGGAAPVTFAKKSQIIIAKKAVNVRKTPDASYNGAIYENKANDNIIYQSKAGAFIGYATGSQSFDVKNNVKFIQIAYTVVSANELPSTYKQYAGKTFTGWVSSSINYVDKFDNTKDLLSKYPKAATDIKYKKPLANSTGVNGLPVRYVLTTEVATILNEKLTPYTKVNENTLLGEYKGEMDTGKNVLVKFQTLDNTERWIDINKIKIIEK